MKAVYCGSCCSLIGYFKNGVAAAVQRYGPGCPWCGSTIHPQAAEARRQQDAHLAWATEGRVRLATHTDSVASAAKVDEPVGHAFFEFETAGDIKGCPREVLESRASFIDFVRNFQARVPAGTAELD